MILPFGQYRGHNINSVPDNYLFWLCDRGRGTYYKSKHFLGIYYKSKHSLDVTWKVPFDVWEAARKEACRRGYEKIGERWEKKKGII